tara:strand:+ start:327 stop:530 length:204 start_codon:yes stop_codon:yes gene_type:complete
MSLVEYAVPADQLPLFVPIFSVTDIFPELSKANNLLALVVASSVNSVEEIEFVTEALMDLSTSSWSC